MLKAFLINLDRSADRLAHVERQFRVIGGAFTRVAAVDGPNLEPRELADFARQRPAHARWTPGELGCFLSHLHVWRKIASGEDEAAAVFEDDIHVARDLKALLASGDWMPSDADLVRLEANRKLLLRDGRSIGVAPGRRVYRMASGTWGSAGYIITRAAAAKLSESRPELHHPVDIFLFKPGRSQIASELACYQIVPAVCIQTQVHAGAQTELQSMIEHGAEMPRQPRSRTGTLTRLLPWKKQAVPFRL